MAIKHSFSHIFFQTDRVSSSHKRAVVRQVEWFISDDYINLNTLNIQMQILTCVSTMSAAFLISIIHIYMNDIVECISRSMLDSNCIKHHNICITLLVSRTSMYEKVPLEQGHFLTQTNFLKYLQNTTPAKFDWRMYRMEVSNIRGKVLPTTIWVAFMSLEKYRIERNI